MNDRIISLVDMDCFYCQVEARLNPSLQGRPLAVVQYNAWKGGGIIAVNYEARARGVTRYMRGDEAKQHCPEIVLVSVPTHRDKADLTKYRDASREVVAVFCTFSDCVERASIDEAFIDLTTAVEKRLEMLTTVTPDHLANSFIVGYSPQKSNDEADRSRGVQAWLEEVYHSGLFDNAAMKLAVAGVIIEEMRAAVFKKTGFKCSAGIAHNKILAKLACGMHKPNKQTILPHPSVEELYKTLPLTKVKGLGGKFGDDLVESLGCKTMFDLTRFSEKELQNRYDEKNGTWLYNIARGMDNEPVTSRLVSKSIGCCKNFPGRNSLATKQDIDHWLTKLVEELVERLMEDQSINKRRAQLLTVSAHLGVRKYETALSRSTHLPSYEVDRIVQISYSLIKRMANISNDSNWTTPLSFLGLSAGKFTEMKTASSISQFFKFVPSSDEKKVHPETNSFVKEESAEKLKSPEVTLESKDENPVCNSFFQKFLNQNQTSELGNKKKLNLIPKLPKDIIRDSDDSQCSVGEVFTDRNKGIISDGNAFSNIQNQNQNGNMNSEACPKESSPNGSIIPSKVTIKSFFSKVEVKKCTSSPVKNSKTSKENSGPISKYFKNQRESNWIDPSEIFPDLNSVDEELISSLPVAFRRKILELKETQVNASVEEKREDIKGGECSINNKNFKLVLNEESVICNPGNLKEDSCSNADNSKGTKEIYSSNNESVSDVKKCLQCDAILPSFLFGEHLDLHLAEKLQREFNSSSHSMPPVFVDRKISHPVIQKRKSKTNKKLVNEKKKIRTIESFFDK